MSSTNQGFIYVSFGSTIQSLHKHPGIYEKFLQAFAKYTEYNFIWKWNGQTPKTYPLNVRFYTEFLPQMQILANNKIKGFIGHGGNNGIHEAIYFNVPMILFPINGDQDYFSHSLEVKGGAIVLEIANFRVHELEAAIETMLYDTK